MSSSMVDRVAIALSGFGEEHWRLRPENKADAMECWKRGEVDRYEMTTKDDFRDDARAAIQAMREIDLRALLDERRFEFLTATADSNGCQLWKGPKDRRDGYGRFYAAGRTISAHRFAWVMKNGAVPDGLVIDHLCRNRACVNAEHLRAITNAENVLCGEGPTARAKRRDSCAHGHPLDEVNLYLRPDGLRDCRICRRHASKRSKDKKRNTALTPPTSAGQSGEKG